MSSTSLSAADLRPMLALAEQLDAPHPFAQKLTELLAGLCRMTNATVAVAYEIQYLPRLKQTVRPLLEVVQRGPGAVPQRSSLTGAASIAGYAMAALERPHRATAQIGLPVWGFDDSVLKHAAGPNRVLHAVQFLDGKSIGIAVVLVRKGTTAPFRQRELTLLETMWKSVRFNSRHPIPQVRAAIAV